MLQWLVGQMIVSDLDCLLLNIALAWIVQAQGGPGSLVGPFFMATYEGDIGMYSVLGSHLLPTGLAAEGLLIVLWELIAIEYWTQFLVENGLSSCYRMNEYTCTLQASFKGVAGGVVVPPFPPPRLAGFRGRMLHS